MSNFSVLPMTTSEVKMLKRTGFIAVNGDGSVMWTAAPHTQCGMLSGVREHARKGDLYCVRGKLVVSE